LFVTHVVSKIPKGDVGLGRQPFMRGHGVDFNTFLTETVEDLKNGSGYAILEDALKKLFAGPYENLVDARVLGDQATLDHEAPGLLAGGRAIP
jgi:hypothetical protein